MGLELVTWRDAHFFLEEDDDDLEEGDYVVETPGWVTVEGKFLRIEGEHTPGGPRAITRVPLENVITAVPLVERAMNP